jgi:hypothetical protein
MTKLAMISSPAVEQDVFVQHPSPDDDGRLQGISASSSQRKLAETWNYKPAQMPSPQS